MKVLQLSILDPVTHTRLFYKIALSLRAAGCEVEIVGADRVKGSPEMLMGVRFTALPLFDRGSLARFFRPFRLLKIALQKKPDILIIHTPELLMMAVLYRFFAPRSILIYDVLEDYKKNLKYHPFMGNFKKKLLSFAVTIWENCWIPFFDSLWYAELCYEHTHNIPASKKEYILNRFTQKALDDLPNIPLPDTPYMVCTGTLNRTWGVKKTLLLWEAFNRISPLHLIISGFTFDEEVRPMIETFVQNSPFRERCTIVGINQYVPYPLILYYIKHCQFGTGLYDLPPSIKGKIPTKFYEFLALKKPLLYTEDNYWNMLNDEWHLGVPVSPHENPETILTRLKKHLDHSPASSPQIYSWEENEEKILFRVVQSWKEKLNKS